MTPKIFWLKFIYIFSECTLEKKILYITNIPWGQFLGIPYFSRVYPRYTLGDIEKPAPDILQNFLKKAQFKNFWIVLMKTLLTVSKYLPVVSINRKHQLSVYSTIYPKKILIFQNNVDRSKICVDNQKHRHKFCWAVWWHIIDNLFPFYNS